MVYKKLIETISPDGIYHIDHGAVIQLFHYSKPDDWFVGGVEELRFKENPLVRLVTRIEDGLYTLYYRDSVIATVWSEWLTAP